MDANKAKELAEAVRKLTCCYCRSGLRTETRHGRTFHIYQGNDGRYCTSRADEILALVAEASKGDARICPICYAPGACQHSHPTAAIPPIQETEGLRELVDDLRKDYVEKTSAH